MASSIESIAGISIKSPYFSNNPTLNLFLDKNGSQETPVRVSLLYGANGSGKSTIAQGFREYVELPGERTVDLTLRKQDGTIYLSDNGRADRIFVFDEKYVDRSVKIQSAGLGAIVLFGQQIELEEQIGRISGELTRLRGEVDQKQEEFQKFLNPNSKESPQYWSSGISKKLRDAGGWAETRGIKINQNRTSAKVTEAEIDRIGMLSTKQSRAALQDAFDRLFRTFSRIDSSAQTVSPAVRLCALDPRTEENTAAMLVQIPQRQELTQRESDLLALFDIHIISTAKGFLADCAKTVCPHCLQPVSEDYRVKTIAQIDHILNPQVEQFKNELEALCAGEISADAYQAYAVVDQTAYENVLRKIAVANEAIRKHNAIVQSKIADPFAAVPYDPSIGILGAFRELNHALQELEQARQAYNQVVSDRKNAKKQLHELNDALAHCAIRDNYDNLCRSRQAMADAQNTIQKLKEEILSLIRQRDVLDAKRRNFQVAADQINQSLEYIFCTNGRLELELGTDQLYHLKSRGQAVSPEKISCGERNALALSYFFTQIANGADASNPYAAEALLVIDDPVSSFDFENKIGILSFLRLKFAQILKACATTKILVSTHDMSVLLDLSDAIADITRYKSIHAPLVHLQLQNKQLVPLGKKKYNEYTSLLERILDYARKYNPDQDLIIGNVMRRALEAFSSFSYKKGIVDVSLDAEILKLLPDENARNYFQNSMYRLVLHGESHFEDAVRCAPEMSFFSRLSGSDKQRTARDVLCFMYKINPLHVLSHLPNAKKDLDAWWSNISSSAV